MHVSKGVENGRGAARSNRDHVFSYRKVSGSRSQIYIADTGAYTDTAQVAIRVTPVASPPPVHGEFLRGGGLEHVRAKTTGDEKG